MNITGGRMKWVLLIGGILVCAICAIVATGGNLLGGSILGGNPGVPPVSNQQPTDDFSSVPINQPTTDFSSVPINSDGSTAVKWGPVVMARSVGEGNVPVETTKQFSSNDRVIYAVAQATVPANTRIFARWSRDGAPFEDTTEIVSDRAYQNTNIEFHIAPDGKAFTPGNYTVQFFVNGNPGPQAQFTVS